MRFDVFFFAALFDLLATLPELLFADVVFALVAFFAVDVRVFDEEVFALEALR